MDDFNMNEDSEAPRFFMPDAFLNQLYELTGNADSHKGFILSYVSEDGTPVVLSKSDSQVVDLGLQHALKQYLAEASENHNIKWPPQEGGE